MSGMRDIKRRIKSVKSTQQITRAMKLVAAAKLRKFQDKLTQYRPFNLAHHDMIGRVIATSDQLNHPLIEPNESDKQLFIVISSDKGLCGGFNQNIIRLAESNILDMEREKIAIFPIGRKGRDFFQKRNYKIWDYKPLILKNNPYQLAQEIGASLIQAYLNNEFGRISMTFSVFKSALAQTPETIPLLPLAPKPTEEEYPQEYIFEPSAQKLFETLLPLSVNLNIYRAMLETHTSEHGARMTAMDSATNNAKDMIASLTLSYNKARQAAITKELIEVVSGADALK